MKTAVTYSRFHYIHSSFIRFRIHHHSHIIGTCTHKHKRTHSQPLHTQMANDLNFCTHIYFFHQSNRYQAQGVRVIYSILCFFFATIINIFNRIARKNNEKSFLLFYEVHGFWYGVGTCRGSCTLWITPKIKYL